MSADGHRVHEHLVHRPAAVCGADGRDVDVERDRQCAGTGHVDDRRRRAIQVVLAPALIFGLPGIHDGIGFTGSAWAFVISRLLTLLATAYVLTQSRHDSAVGRLERRAAFVARGAAHRRAVDHDEPDRAGVDGRRVRTAREIRPRGRGRIRRCDTDRIAGGDDPDGDVGEHRADGRPELGCRSVRSGSTRHCGSVTAFRSRGACSSSRCWRSSDAASSA